jgi:hypothetical protein
VSGGQSAPAPTALELLAQVREAQGIPKNPAELPRWRFQFSGRTFSLPNFDWRRNAIDAHDLHHLVLGEPFTFAGECQVATWEFAAGAFPDMRAQIFCLPLVAWGAATAPARTWQSFRTGSDQRSLYGSTVDRFATLEQLSTLVAGPDVCRDLSSPRPMIRFCFLLAQSVALYLIPCLFMSFLFVRDWP